MRVRVYKALCRSVNWYLPVRGSTTHKVRVVPRRGNRRKKAKSPTHGGRGAPASMTDETRPKSGSKTDEPMTTHVKTYKEANPTGVATPINPHVVKLLEAIRKLGTEDPARLANETKMDLDTLKTALIIARAVKLIGRGGTLTREGEMVLEVVSRLRERAEHERT